MKGVLVIVKVNNCMFIQKRFLIHSFYFSVISVFSVVYFLFSSRIHASFTLRLIECLKKNATPA